MTGRVVNFVDVNAHLSSKAEQEFVAGLHAMRSQRRAFYWDWRPDAFPFVTLKQGAWLLLGLDPIQLEPALPPYRVLRKRRFRELLNRLECAVVANELRPVGRHVDGFARRFRLVDIAATALRINLATDHAKEILAVIKDKPAMRAHYEAVDLQERLEIHRQFVASLGAAAISVEPKFKTLNRRKSSTNPVNRRLAISRPDYDEAFRNFRDRQNPNQAGEQASPKMLDDDRRQLNIQLKKGRPRK